MSSDFLEFRRSLPEAARKALPLRPRLLEETAEAMVQATPSLWLVIVPEDGPPELAQYTGDQALSQRLELLQRRGFMGNVYIFEGTRVLLSKPPQSYLVFSDGRLVPLLPPPDLLQVDPEGRLDPEDWEGRMAAHNKRSSKRRRKQTSGVYDDDEYAMAGDGEEDDSYTDGADDAFDELATMDEGEPETVGDEVPPDDVPPDELP